ncbi:site-specific integrase [Streptomyces sp. UNOC14_S4]|uniref:tyrosine-type recombinase/integrase n=1 Tax=Streptomyces sp. UNOC14_S4 TaxID=2872340 RepID=UPI001E2C14EF|nr:site-specific integrase [Streptomyces sp. UNOC14_S4]MCC3767679.1 site-specific integrase [Streptomyces sp. UNOC14_S4]
MASIKSRARANGELSHTVVWRVGGARAAPSQSETFSDIDSAKAFRDLVNDHGQQWPPGWVKGTGFVQEPEPEVVEEELFEIYALQYVDRLTGVQAGTRSNYRKMLERHIVPWFKDLSVRQGPGGIGRDEVRDWVNDLEQGRPGTHHPPGTKRRAFAPKTIRNLHGLLYGILQSAVTAEPPLRSTNPCLHTRLPEDNSTEDEQVFLEREEYALIRSHMHADSVDLIDALAGTGLRWSEIAALQPRDLSLHGARPTLRVQRAWKRVDGGKEIGPPKTKKSRRTMVLSPYLVALFKRRCRDKDPKDYVFTAPEGGPWDSGGFYHARWKLALTAAAKEGLTKRPRIHDLRHSHASWLIAAKVPLPAIQKRLGHESITTTVDRYGHLLAELDDEIITAIEWSMNPAASLADLQKEASLAA